MSSIGGRCTNSWKKSEGVGCPSSSIFKKPLYSAPLQPTSLRPYNPTAWAPLRLEASCHGSRRLRCELNVIEAVVHAGTPRRQLTPPPTRSPGQGDLRHRSCAQRAHKVEAWEPFFCIFVYFTKIGDIEWYSRSSFRWPPFCLGLLVAHPALSTSPLRRTRVSSAADRWPRLPPIAPVPVAVGGISCLFWSPSTVLPS